MNKFDKILMMLFRFLIGLCTIVMVYSFVSCSDIAFREVTKHPDRYQFICPVLEPEIITKIVIKHDTIPLKIDSNYIQGVIDFAKFEAYLMCDSLNRVQVVDGKVNSKHISGTVNIKDNHLKIAIQCKQDSLLKVIQKIQITTTIEKDSLKRIIETKLQPCDCIPKWYMPGFWICVCIIVIFVIGLVIGWKMKKL